MTFSFSSPIILQMEASGFPTAWVVKCKKCTCTINCTALDPQLEHAEPHKAEPPPTHALLVTCSCCWSAFRYEPTSIFKGSPARGSACPRDQKETKAADGRVNNAILVAASVIAAVRLNRDEIKPTPAVQAKISDSITLAEMIHRRLERR